MHTESRIMRTVFWKYNGIILVIIICAYYMYFQVGGERPAREIFDLCKTNVCCKF